MPSTSLHSPTPELERVVRELEAQLLQGDARRDEIDAYVRLQIELAERHLARGPRAPHASSR